MPNETVFSSRSAYKTLFEKQIKETVYSETVTLKPTVYRQQKSVTIYLY